MNYIIENNINFFDELKKELNSIHQNNSETNNQDNNQGNNEDNNQANNLSNNEDNICLLTHQPFEKNAITLPCTHKFNYIPLYNEICHQKINNYLETTYLSLNQIKCPYCRNISNKLLPFISHKDVILKRGVNYPQKYCMTLHTCDWKIKSGKNKNEQCNKSAYKSDFGIYCSTHQNIYNKKNKHTENINKLKSTSKYNNWSENHTKLYKKYNIKQLKEIINIENKKTSIKKFLIGGVKQDLVNRIIINKLIDITLL